MDEHSADWGAHVWIIAKVEMVTGAQGFSPFSSLLHCMFVNWKIRVAFGERGGVNNGTRAWYSPLGGRDRRLERRASLVAFDIAHLVQRNAVDVHVGPGR